MNLQYINFVYFIKIHQSMDFKKNSKLLNLHEIAKNSQNVTLRPQFLMQLPKTKVMTTIIWK